MIIDGEELRLQCKQCGTKYKHIIGYGPIFPNSWMRKKSLRENPPVCPKCGSHSWDYRSFLDRLFK